MIMIMGYLSNSWYRVVPFLVCLLTKEFGFISGFTGILSRLFPRFMDVNLDAERHKPVIKKFK